MAKRKVTKERAGKPGTIGSIKSKKGTFELRGYSRRRLEKHFRTGGKAVPITITGLVIQPKGKYKSNGGQDFQVRVTKVKSVA